MTEQSHVVIGLKDVYQQVQSLEKSLSDALATLNITMTQIKGHMESVDLRNAAADQLHKEHADRLRKLEDLTTAADPLATHARLDERVRSLEASAATTGAVDAARGKARSAFWAAVGAGAAAAGALLTVLSHIHH